MAKDESLKTLSEKILNNEVDETKYSINSRLENLSNIYNEKDEIKKILIMGINPAGDSNKYDEKYIGFIPNISDEDYENIKAKLGEECKNYFNINYFKSNYNLFLNAKMTWGLSKDNKEKLKNDLKELLDIGFVENIITKINENIEDKSDRLIFVDLVYYHDTNAETVKSILNDRYKSDYENLKSNIKEVLKKHIEMFKPSLIVVTNAYVSNLIYGLFIKQVNNLDDLKKEEITTDVIEVKYKEKQVPIILSGMVSGGHTDNYAYFRLKKRIKKICKGKYKFTNEQVVEI